VVKMADRWCRQVRKADWCDPIDNRLVSRILSCVWLVTVLALLSAGPSSADNSNKGLGPEASVPAWARNKNIHFLAPPRSHSAITPALGGRSGASHNDLGLRCEPGYCPQPPLAYRGGVVQHNPTVYLVFWGSNFNKGTLRTEMLDLFNSLSSTGTNPSYQGILTQYWDGGGSIAPIDVVAGNFIDTRIAAPSGVSEKNVEEEVAYAISVNGWPPSGNNPQYVVLTPSGTTYQSSFVKNSKGEAAFCGYHERTGGVSYSFVPSEYDEPFYGCAQSFDHSGPNGETLPNHATTMVASHEYAESATDPEPVTHPGWKDNEGYEIGDICSSSDDKLPGGSWVQGLWGNHENACVLQDPPYSPPPAPTVITEAATSIQYRQANLNGSVNPNGPDAHYHFQYGTTTGYGSSTPEGDAGYGNSNTGESSTATGLKPGTTYHYRLVASSWVGTSNGADREFTTPIPPPVVKTETPTEVGEVHVTLNAVVNPEEFSTTYQFEYWPRGKSSEVTKIPSTAESVGSGASNVKVHQRPDLRPTTEYIYRVAAANAGGQSRGQEVIFTTGPFLENHPTPNPGGAEQSILYGVSCTSASWCMGVGYSKSTAHVFSPLAENWNGTEWSLNPPVSPSGGKEASLMSVSCTSSAACTAVGSYVNSSGVHEPLVERWNGATWVIQSTPSAPAKDVYELRGVVCMSSSSCMAVGANVTGVLESATLSESWNGAEWKVVATPGGGALEGISCTSSSACTAVGGTALGGEPLAERWNGTEWSTQKAAKISSASLSGVACMSATSCIAVGISGGIFGSPASNISERWDGTEWSIVSVPTPVGAKESTLRGVSCSSTTSCIAVGISGELIESPTTLADTWNGKEWQIMSVSLPAGVRRSHLYSVSCASAYCKTDGSYENSSGIPLTLEGTMAQPGDRTETASSITSVGATLNASVDPNGRETTYHFEYGETVLYGTNVPVPDGNVKSTVAVEKLSQAITSLQPETTYHYRIVATNPSGTSEGADHTFTTSALPWSVDVTPNPSGAEQSVLYGMSCMSSSWCMGVGYSKSTAHVLAPLAESWNGTEWSLSTPASPSGGKEASLVSVSCTSSAACTAVGSYMNGSGTYEPLVERWNGSAWTIQSTPSAPAKDTYELRSVACTSASSCMVVGEDVIGALESVTLSESWNGAEWKVIATPSGGALEGISCTSVNVCTAVGGTAFGGEPLAERWNGTEWSTQKAAKISSASLSSVACMSATSCIAVGSSGGIFGSPASNISESWNGTEWSTVSVPAPSGAKESILRGVSCSSTKSCIAAGTSGELITSPIALADTWNGKEWRILSLPLPSGVRHSNLYSVSCASVYCTTDGYYENGSGTLLTLADSN
jgi:hypothetical protein